VYLFFPQDFKYFKFRIIKLLAEPLVNIANVGRTMRFPSFEMGKAMNVGDYN